MSLADWFIPFKIKPSGSQLSTSLFIQNSHHIYQLQDNFLYNSCTDSNSMMPFTPLLEKDMPYKNGYLTLSIANGRNDNNE